jgi:hypothetical protein
MSQHDEPLMGEKPLPPVLVVRNPGTEETIMALHADGTMDFGDAYKPDEAAREFWCMLRQLSPTLGNPPLEGFTDGELLYELARRKPN